MAADGVGKLPPVYWPAPAGAADKKSRNISMRETDMVVMILWTDGADASSEIKEVSNDRVYPLE
jgi:hypothetical protein